ncbi:unnamed protein product [Cuscuta epithymum]|uniref:Aminoacyl-transfer RNA synthetases class-II family profile domain-containing protein n=1 Tax=Cuscuta epithymum TaxID=186058 RepID=A0AAV0FSS2_9ASTE|nr:unnamed protein product [Cuscuta epithymum]
MSSLESMSDITPSSLSSKYTYRLVLKTIFERDDDGVGLFGERVVIGGWVKISKELKIKEKSDMQNLSPPLYSMLEVNDGSSVKNLQVLVDSKLESPEKVMPTGTCIVVEGILQKASTEGKHHIELLANKILHLGTVDKNEYLLTRRTLPLTVLRNYPHLQPRTAQMTSIMRMHNSAFTALRTFYQANGFLYVQVPIITDIDTRESDKKFHVIVATNEDQRKKEENAGEEEMSGNKEEDGYMESQDYFSELMHLTSSGHFHLQSQASALGNVYTYGPFFRPDPPYGIKSLAEMWKVETEMAFSQLEDAMDCAEDLLKFMCKWILEKCIEDVMFLSKPTATTLIEELQLVTSSSFKRISYRKLLEDMNAVSINEELGIVMEFGHVLIEGRLLMHVVTNIYKRPVIVYDHPKELKPFHVRLNDDGKTVASFDIFFPHVGFVLSGSQSEERLDTLISRIEEVGLRQEQLKWYLDLRKHGNTTHSGFSLKLDSLLLYAGGFKDLGDVAPFPKYHSDSESE